MADPVFGARVDAERTGDRRRSRPDGVEKLQLSHSLSSEVFSYAARCTALAVVLVAFTGCSGSSDASSSGSQPPEAVLFHEAGCAGCHSLVKAGARGRTGPDLDSSELTYADVVRRVRLGGAGMPAFADRLSDTEVAALASFVANASGRPTAADFDPDETRLAECDGSHACFEQAFGNLAFEQGPSKALEEFAHSVRVDPAIERDCHRIAHVIGAAALRYYDGQYGEAFSVGSTICASGYYHGITERAFSHASASELEDVARRLCRGSRIRATAFLAYQCIHGLGHGLMIVTGYDLPRSLAVCDRLRTGWDRRSCSGGVFMENISSSYGVRSKWLRDDDPIYPCPVVAARHKLYCYLIVTSRVLELVGYDFRKAAAVCRESERGWVATCFQSLGRDASGQARGAPLQILDRCRPAGNQMRECLFGAARDLTYNDAGPHRAVKLCRLSAPPLRSYCFYAIGTIIADLYALPAERNRACARASPATRGREACRSGAQLAS